MEERRIPPGLPTQPEGKNAPTHNEFGEAYDQQNEAKGVFPWLIGAVVIVGFTIASHMGWV